MGIRAVKWLWGVGVVVLSAAVVAWLGLDWNRSKAAAIGCLALALLAFGNALHTWRR